MKKLFKISNYPYKSNPLLFVYRKLTIKLLGRYSFPKFSLISHLVRFYKLSGIDEFMVRYYVSRIPFEKIWLSKERENRKDYESFYKEHEGGIWRQAYQSAFEKSYKYKISYVVDSIRKAGFSKKCKIIDYGCGAGAVANALYNYGFKNIMLADIDSSTLDFVKKALAEEFREIITIKDDSPLTEKYDVIIAYDCLEHTFAPCDILRHLIESLNDNGLFILYYPKEKPNMTHTEIGQDQRERCMEYLRENLKVLDEELLYRKTK